MNTKIAHWDSRKYLFRNLTASAKILVIFIGAMKSLFWLIRWEIKKDQNISTYVHIHACAVRFEVSKKLRFHKKIVRSLFCPSEWLWSKLRPHSGILYLKSVVELWNTCKASQLDSTYSIEHRPCHMRKNLCHK